MPKSITWLTWVAFGLFVLGAFYTHWHPGLLIAHGPVGWAKYAIWAAFLAFAGYSLHCSRHEDLLTTVKKVGSFYFGRQIILDLYLGVGGALFLVYLHSGSWVTLLIWLIPMLTFANLATLLYLGLHFDSIVGLFLG